MEYTKEKLLLCVRSLASESNTKDAIYLTTFKRQPNFLCCICKCIKQCIQSEFHSDVLYLSSLLVDTTINDMDSIRGIVEILKSVDKCENRKEIKKFIIVAFIKYFIHNRIFNLQLIGMIGPPGSFINSNKNDIQIAFKSMENKVLFLKECFLNEYYDFDDYYKNTTVKWLLKTTKGLKEVIKFREEYKTLDIDILKRFLTKANGLTAIKCLVDSARNYNKHDHIEIIINSLGVINDKDSYYVNHVKRLFSYCKELRKPSDGENSSMLNISKVSFIKKVVEKGIYKVDENNIIEHIEYILKVIKNERLFFNIFAQPYECVEYFYSFDYSDETNVISIANNMFNYITIKHGYYIFNFLFKKTIYGISKVIEEEVNKKITDKLNEEESKMLLFNEKNVKYITKSKKLKKFLSNELSNIENGKHDNLFWRINYPLKLLRSLPIDFKIDELFNNWENYNIGEFLLYFIYKTNSNELKKKLETIKSDRRITYIIQNMNNLKLDDWNYIFGKLPGLHDYSKKNFLSVLKMGEIFNNNSIGGLIKRKLSEVDAYINQQENIHNNFGLAFIENNKVEKSRFDEHKYGNIAQIRVTITERIRLFSWYINLCIKSYKSELYDEDIFNKSKINMTAIIQLMEFCALIIETEHDLYENCNCVELFLSIHEFCLHSNVMMSNEKFIEKYLNVLSKIIVELSKVIRLELNQNNPESNIIQYVNCFYRILESSIKYKRIYKYILENNMIIDFCNILVMKIYDNKSILSKINPKKGDKELCHSYRKYTTVFSRFFYNVVELFPKMIPIEKLSAVPILLLSNSDKLIEDTYELKNRIGNEMNTLDDEEEEEEGEEGGENDEIMSDDKTNADKNNLFDYNKRISGIMNRYNKNDKSYYNSFFDEEMIHDFYEGISKLIEQYKTEISKPVVNINSIKFGHLIVRAINKIYADYWGDVGSIARKSNLIQILIKLSQVNLIEYEIHYPGGLSNEEVVEIEKIFEQANEDSHFIRYIKIRMRPYDNEEFDTFSKRCSSTRITGSVLSTDEILEIRSIYDRKSDEYENGTFLHEVKYKTIPNTNEDIELFLKRCGSIKLHRFPTYINDKGAFIKNYENYRKEVEKSFGKNTIIFSKNIPTILLYKLDTLKYIFLKSNTVQTLELRSTCGIKENDINENEHNKNILKYNKISEYKRAIVHFKKKLIEDYYDDIYNILLLFLDLGIEMKMYIEIARSSGINTINFRVYNYIKSVVHDVIWMLIKTNRKGDIVFHRLMKYYIKKRLFHVHQCILNKSGDYNEAMKTGDKNVIELMEKLKTVILQRNEGEVIEFFKIVLTDKREKDGEIINIVENIKTNECKNRLIGTLMDFGTSFNSIIKFQDFIDMRDKYGFYKGIKVEKIVNWIFNWLCSFRENFKIFNTLTSGYEKIMPRNNNYNDCEWEFLNFKIENDIKDNDFYKFIRDKKDLRECVKEFNLFREKHSLTFEKERVVELKYDTPFLFKRIFSKASEIKSSKNNTELELNIKNKIMKTVLKYLNMTELHKKHCGVKLLLPFFFFDLMKDVDIKLVRLKKYLESTPQVQGKLKEDKKTYIDHDCDEVVLYKSILIYYLLYYHVRGDKNNVGECINMISHLSWEIDEDVYLINSILGSKAKTKNYMIYRQTLEYLKSNGQNNATTVYWLNNLWFHGRHDFV